VQHCWPGDAAPLITWGLVVTRGPEKSRQNLGIYRMQVIGRNRVIMRWLAHRGGALDFRDWQRQHPASRSRWRSRSAPTRRPSSARSRRCRTRLSEYAFAGLLRGSRTELAACIGSDLQVPASAEIVLEGHLHPDDTAPEGPFGDHTGYYNEVDSFPVFTIERITHAREPIYHSTYTGRPPDEPAILGVALNEVFVPILQKQFPEIVDFYLPPEGCSYRLAVVSMKKQYPGHAKRVMMGVWSFLRQFMYTKFVIVVDDDVNTRDWKDVIWAMTTRMDPARDTVMVENTPIDYLDFASPVSGLGSKIGFDATNKWPGETNREWGEPDPHGLVRHLSRRVSILHGVVQRLDGVVRFRIVGHLDEAEALRLAGELVLDHIRTHDLAELGEHVAQLIVRHRVLQVAYVYTHHSHSKRSCIADTRPERRPMHKSAHKPAHEPRRLPPSPGALPTAGRDGNGRCRIADSEREYGLRSKRRDELESSPSPGRRQRDRRFPPPPEQ
jgi:hypothetical protein